MMYSAGYLHASPILSPPLTHTPPSTSSASTEKQSYCEFDFPTLFYFSYRARGESLQMSLVRLLPVISRPAYNLDESAASFGLEFIRRYGRYLQRNGI